MKIVEASISILIIAGMLFFILAKTKAGAISPDYDESARDFLEEISKNASLRQAVLEGNIEDIEEFMDRRLPLGSVNYDFTICDINAVCGLDKYVEGEVFAQERVISADIRNDFSPKKLRIFIWQK